MKESLIATDLSLKANQNEEKEFRMKIIYLIKNDPLKFNL